MKDIKRESWEDFQKRIGIDLSEKLEDEDFFLARFIYFNSIYVNEQKLNWRRQILRIKKTLTAIRKNGDSN